MKIKTDKLFLVLSIVFGLIVGIFSETMYEDALCVESRIICMVLAMVVFALVMGVIILFKGLLNGAYKNFGKVMMLTLLSFVVFVGSTALLEFLYELEGAMKINPIDKFQYAFLIDDSGSMYTNDPADERYDAVEKIINNMDSTEDFAVYRFSNYTYCSTPMGSELSDNYVLDKAEVDVGDGTETNIIGSVDSVVDENAEQSDKHTKVIVLTDGYPSDDRFGKLNSSIKKCLKKNASVSFIGFGSTNNNFLQDYSDNTGGMFVYTDNLDDLVDNLETVVNADTVLKADRDLLGYRLDSKADSVLYAIMRIIFLMILGGLWTLIKMLLVGERKYTKKGMVVSLVLCSIAAVFVEVMLLMGTAGDVVRVIFYGLWACTIIPVKMYEPIKIEQNLSSGITRNTPVQPARGLDDVERSNRPKTFL